MTVREAIQKLTEEDFIQIGMSEPSNHRSPERFMISRGLFYLLKDL